MVNMGLISLDYVTYIYVSPGWIPLILQLSIFPNTCKSLRNAVQMFPFSFMNIPVICQSKHDHGSTCFAVESAIEQCNHVVNLSSTMYVCELIIHDKSYSTKTQTLWLSFIRSLIMYFRSRILAGNHFNLPEK